MDTNATGDVGEGQLSYRGCGNPPLCDELHEDPDVACTCFLRGLPRRFLVRLVSASSRQDSKNDNARFEPGQKSPTAVPGRSIKAWQSTSKSRRVQRISHCAP